MPGANSPSPTCRAGWLAAALAFSTFSGSVSADSTLDLLPLAGRDVTLQGDDQFRALGPLIETRDRGAVGDFLAVRPFYSRENYSNGNYRVECLWPLLRIHGNSNAWRWSVIAAWGREHGRTNGNSDRTIILPFYFSGRDSTGAAYQAIFPLGGSIHDFMGQGRITFWAFPAYLSLETGSNRAYSVLWPFIAWSKGARTERLRLFPFYSRSIRYDEWDKRSVLWPFWTQARYTGGPVTGNAFVLFPLLGYASLSDQKSWMLLPPFFRYSRNDGGYRAVNAPWPFIQYCRETNGTGKTYVWPLWGRRTSLRSSTYFYLWPFGSDLKIHHPEKEIHRHAFLPIYYSERVRPVPASNTADVAAARPPVQDSRYVKIWPLASYHRQGNEGQFRMLDLWPGRWAEPIERNYAPLWTLYRHQWTTNASERELLWGLARHRRENGETTRAALFPLFSFRQAGTGGERRYSFLAGLFQYQQEGLQRTYRALYFLRFSRTSTEQDSATP